VKLTAHLHLMSTLRTPELYLHSPIFLPDIVLDCKITCRDIFTFYHFHPGNPARSYHSYLFMTNAVAKLVLHYDMKTRWRAQRYAFLASALDGSFTLYCRRKCPRYPLHRRLGELQEKYGHCEQKHLCPARESNPNSTVVQAKPSQYIY
jgi:hypothetical protein